MRTFALCYFLLPMTVFLTLIEHLDSRYGAGWGVGAHSVVGESSPLVSRSRLFLQDALRR